MKIEETAFQGLFLIQHNRFVDDRGVFVKPWLYEELSSIFPNVSETYFSSSKEGTFRGLHYQIGERAQKKYIVCLSGLIEDIAVDMRPSSLTYGRVFRHKIGNLSGIGVIVPEGFAHGIFAHEPSIIVNFCDKPYSPGNEGGINPRSITQISDLKITTLSEKDANLPSISEVLK
jgi:dTDP-4-dehydrorhamnose 3,5-epimerase